MGVATCPYRAYLSNLPTTLYLQTLDESFVGVFDGISGNFSMFIRPTLMGTKNLYENGPNPFFFLNLMETRMVQIRKAKSV